jgi:hypothetical protein
VTLVLTGLILYGRPFQIAGQALSSLFGMGDNTAKVEEVFRDSGTQEVTAGGDPYRSLEALRRRWAASKPERSLVVIGNSQTLSVVLAPGEIPPTMPPKTYVDRIAERFAAAGGPAVYRLSAPNLSYLEALWYVTYLTTVSNLRPSEIVLQLNYESFRKTGIRDGMLGLLRDPKFARVVQEMAGSGSLYGAAFGQAVKRYEETRRKAESQRDGKREGSGHPALLYGERMEAVVRRVLESNGIQAKKHEAKSDILNLLYLLRVYVLRITPTTPRPLSGAAYEASVSALNAIAEKCRDNGVDLALFLAPQNPAVRLWRTKEDRARYRNAAQGLAARYGLKLVDLENSIPKDEWGVWIDGPDPIHFGLRGHMQMTDVMMKTGFFH